jgi:hypothetical protein
MLVLITHVNNKENVKLFLMVGLNVIVYLVIQDIDVKLILMIVFRIDVKIMEHVLIKSMIIHVLVHHYLLVSRKNIVKIVFLFLRFIGKYCEQKLNWCEGNLNPCKNNGRCLRSNNGYK